MHEVGIIEHEGKRFANLGATCDGTHLTAYVKECRSRVVLTNWQGEQLISLRAEYGKEWHLNEFCDKGQTLLLRCGRGHWIGGLSLGNGMLFRGEAFRADDDEDAMNEANETARIFAELDYEDSQRSIDDDE